MTWPRPKRILSGGSSVCDTGKSEPKYDFSASLALRVCDRLDGWAGPPCVVRFPSALDTGIGRMTNGLISKTTPSPLSWPPTL